MNFFRFWMGPLYNKLDEAIAGAIKDAPALPTLAEGEEGGEKIVAPEVKVEEEKVVVPSKEDEKDEFGLTAKDTIEAKQLLAALRDPAKAPTVVDFLAQQAGYKKPETKKEAVAQAKDLVTELKEALGPELEYIADKMGPILKKHLEDQVGAAKSELNEKFKTQEMEKLEIKSAQAQDIVGKKYFKDGKIPENLAKSMNKIFDRYEATPDQSMTDYIQDVLFLAAQKEGVALTDLSKQQKIEKNRTDAPSRLASDGVQAPREGEKAAHPQRQMSLKESVEAAVEAAKAGLEK